MPAVVDRVACPECGAQKGKPCRDAKASGARPHDARFEALWALNRALHRRLSAAKKNDRSAP